MRKRGERALLAALALCLLLLSGCGGRQPEESEEEQEIESLEEEIDNLEQEIQNLKEENKKLQKRVEGLSEDKNELKDNIRTLYEHDLHSVESAMSGRRLVWQIHAQAMEALLTGDTAERIEKAMWIRTDFEELELVLNNLDETFSGHPDTVAEARQEYEAVAGPVDTLLDMIAAERLDEAWAYFQAEVKPCMDALRETLALIGDEADMRAQAEGSEVLD